MNPNDSQNLIRITKEDALSGHVDDMLKRQMGMRGEPGVTRDRKRVWYYQNWFVFALVGALGAVAGWALLEPIFDDRTYLQGAVSEITKAATDDTPKRKSSRKKLSADFNSDTNGIPLNSVTINEEKVYFTSSAHEIRPDGSMRRFRFDSLTNGETLGVYLEHIRGLEDEGISFVDFVVRSPSPKKNTPAEMTIEKIQSRHSIAGLLLFPLVAGMIGLFVGAGDGIVCRLPRRALLCGFVGLLVGFVGGFLCSMIAGVVYTPLTALALKQSNAEGGLNALGFAIQIIGRAFAWSLAGLAMGLGQGIALRSKRLLLYGLLGGIVGGLLGGLLFDPIDLILLGEDKPSAHWSRLIGFAVIGLSVGAMIGLVELLARDAWLRMTQGPLSGKEFLIFKDVMNVGASPKSDIYLFNDPLVAQQHAIIRAMSDECEIEALQSANPVLLNNRPITRARLRHGDNVTIGRTSFVFQQRKS